jgi:proline dehydrogenase
MKHVIPMEVHASRVFNFNLGVKLIRGAYMNEERDLATTNGYTSPVWPTIEQTHECYDTNLAHIISHMTPADQILVASHNKDSVEIARRALAENYRLRHA